MDDHERIVYASRLAKLPLLDSDGATIGRVAAREPTLEDAYVALVSE